MAECVRVDDPLVAVAVMVSVPEPAGVPVGVVDVVALPEPPQPIKARLEPRHSKAIRMATLRNRRRKPTAGITSRERRRVPVVTPIEAERTVVVTVTVVVAVVEPGVTVPGEMVQVDAAGAPVQERRIAVENPPDPGVSEMVAVLPVVAPAATVMPAAGTARAKSEVVTMAGVKVEAEVKSELPL